jgi:hypothetical protein
MKPKPKRKYRNYSFEISKAGRYWTDGKPEVDQPTYLQREIFQANWLIAKMCFREL